MTRPLLLISAVAVVSCTGLYLENGNTYPCDFAKPPNERDMPCIAGDVCSVSNVCVRYIYEGPRFEGPPEQPHYGFETIDALHPRTLTSPITLLGRDTSRRGLVLAQTADVAVRVTERGEFFDSQPIDLTLRDPILGQAQFGAVPIPVVVGIDTRTSHVVYRGRLPGGGEVANDVGPLAKRLRFSPVGTFFHIAGGAQPSGALTNPSLMSPAFELNDAGTYLFSGDGFDVATLSRLGATSQTTIALADTGLWVQSTDGGFSLAAMSPLTVTDGELSLNAASTLLTQVLNHRVLSTWQVGLDRGAHTLQLAWPDCTPCRDGIALVTPSPQEDGLSVDVLCGTLAIRSLVRVTGSNATAPGDACITQTLPLPFDISRVQFDGRGPVHAAVQRGAALGGKNGEVWLGETISSMLPLTLERVPLDVSTMKTRAQAGDEPTTALAALTDRYLAVLPPRAPTLQSPTGFRRIDALANLGSDEDVRFMAAVHGTDGWAVLGSGVTAAVSLDLGEDGGTRDALRFGRRLVSPSGLPVTRSAGGEAFVFTDGGLAALYIAADDGLYAIGSPEGSLDTSTGGSADVTPQLQPEPSVPIRSLALERTPLGTDGVSRARGYLVTSRNVYEWKLAGSPARWSSRLLALAGGEPVEVWFDQSRSALGRVGYADGQIFTLPSGFQLAEPLPGGDSGVTTKVLDYENFGGWPVALTTTGLYSAGWPLGADGGVQNRFPDGRPNRPMGWTRRSLPDGGVPWERGDDTKGRLFVQQLTNNETNGKRRFRLLIFLPEQVLELAQYERK